MPGATTEVLIEYDGTYGGRQSRDEVLRVLKEALALVENVEPPDEILCSGFRIEVVRAGNKGSR